LDIRLTEIATTFFLAESSIQTDYDQSE